MADRCGGCGYRFDREDGFFLGALVINFGVTIVGVAVAMGVLIAVLAGSGSSGAVAATAVAAVLVAVLVPVVFYPFSKTLWAAVDLAMHRGEAWARLPAARPQGDVERPATTGT